MGLEAYYQLICSEGKARKCLLRKCLKNNR